MQEITLLSHALLAFLYGKPGSGYDLRKFFAATPMGNFSDSPGAIYPALRRLEKQKLISAGPEKRSPVRRRRILHLTALGSQELKAWLAAPLCQADLERRMNVLMLRFAFMDDVLGVAATVSFLRSFRKELRAYIPSLVKYLEEHSRYMPTSARLALESGLRSYEAQAQWTEHAISVYQRKGDPQ